MKISCDFFTSEIKPDLLNFLTNPGGIGPQNGLGS